MAIKSTFSDEQERAFERELLSVLKREPTHQFCFDGKLRFQSRRYGCEMKAMNVHWDEAKGDIVLVGAFYKGKPQIDMSKGYPVIQSEFSIPFRECYDDLKQTPGFNEMYLISKTRKAVIDKSLGFPMKVLEAGGALQRGGVDFSDFDVRQPAVLDGSEQVGSVTLKDGVYAVHSSKGYFLDVQKMSLLDIQRIGTMLSSVNDIVREARKTFIQGKNAELPSGSVSLSERDIRCAEEAGLRRVYDQGFPIRCCDVVAKSFSRSYKDVFDTELHSLREIDRMMREVRSKGREFGFRPERSKEQTVKLS